MNMLTKINELEAKLREILGDRTHQLVIALGEITLTIGAKNYLEVMHDLRDSPALAFDQLIDLCGLDYSTYSDGNWRGSRFAVVTHLLSTSKNWRLRVRVFASDDELPIVSSMVQVWNSANWYEREAFDLFGILFDGHNDLRRILTDYGFIGHPFRKDFPVSGYVEMKYDESQKRVIYQPVTIEPRENTPRIIREENYGI
jgi:NADH-quinone oxidoreductase subunit C